jgi:hypothetical protein
MPTTVIVHYPDYVKKHITSDGWTQDLYHEVEFTTAWPDCHPIECGDIFLDAVKVEDEDQDDAELALECRCGHVAYRTIEFKAGYAPAPDQEELSGIPLVAHCGDCVGYRSSSEQSQSDESSDSDDSDAGSGDDAAGDGDVIDYYGSGPEEESSSEEEVEWCTTAGEDESQYESDSDTSMTDLVEEVTNLVLRDQYKDDDSAEVTFPTFGSLSADKSFDLAQAVRFSQGKYLAGGYIGVNDNTHPDRDRYNQNRKQDRRGWPRS